MSNPRAETSFDSCVAPLLYAVPFLRVGLREEDALTRTAAMARRALAVRVRSRIATAPPVEVRKHRNIYQYSFRYGCVNGTMYDVRCTTMVSVNFLVICCAVPGTVLGFTYSTYPYQVYDTTLRSLHKRTSIG